MADKVYHMVTGDQLPNFIGKTITLFGVVTKNGIPGSSNFILNTSDNMSININVTEYLTEDITGSYVEIRGVCENKQLIKAEDYFKFNNKQFDVAGYNQLCQFLNNIPDIFDYIPGPKRAEDVF